MRSHGFCDFEQGSRAGRIINCAIEDLVLIEILAGCTGLLFGLLAEMIPVRRVQHVFIRGRLAGQAADHIATLKLVNGLRNLSAGLHALKRHRLEVLGLCLLFQSFQIQPRAGKQGFCRVARDPALKHGALCTAIGANEIRLCAAPGIGNNVPTV